MVHLRRTCLLLLLFALPLLQGCYAIAAAKFGPVITEVQDMACAMYDARQENLGPPLPEQANRVRRFGRDRFVGWLVEPKISHRGCRDLHKFVYAIGWFGDIWHLDLIVEWLQHEQPEVRRNALAAFCHLTGQRFDNEHDALLWWSEHRSDFPRFDLVDLEKSGDGGKKG